MGHACRSRRRVDDAIGVGSWIIRSEDEFSFEFGCVFVRRTVAGIVEPVARRFAVGVPSLGLDVVL